MMRVVAAALAAVLVGLPLLVLPSWPVATVALAAASVCAAGILALAIPVVTAGAALALIAYTLAVWLAAGSPDVVTAGVFGLALVLLLEVVDFGRRVHGVLLGPGVISGHVRYWLATSAAALGAMTLLSAAATVIAVVLPRPAYPALAAVGALLAFAGATAALRAESSRGERGERDDALRSASP